MEKVCNTVMLSDFAYQELEFRARQADELAEALEHVLKYQGMYCHEAYHGRNRANRILADYRKSKEQQ